jgi:MFS family permease
MLARGWLVFELTGSSLAVGVVTFAGMSQLIIVGPIAGAVADRLDRRQLALIAVLIMMVSSSILAALTLGDWVQVWHVVALAVGHGVAMAIAQPAIQALIPNLVPDRHLLNAVSLSGISQHGSRVAGPLVGGILLATLGAGISFVFATLILIFALIQLLLIEHRPPVETRSGQSPMSVTEIGREVAAGITHIRHDARLFTIIGCVGFHCAFTMAYEALLPQIATNIGGGSNTYSAIVVGIGAGAIVGVLCVSLINNPVRQGRVFSLTAAGSGIAMIVLGTTTNTLIAVIAAIIAGGTQASYMAISNALVQKVVPDSFRGRVMSIFAMIAGGLMAFMNLGYGWLADTVHVQLLILIPSVAWIIIFIAAAVFLPEFQSVLRLGVFRPHATTRPVTEP